MTDDATYQAHLLGVVDAFLHTVVVVDDRAFRATRPSPEPDDDPKPGAVPGGRAVTTELRPPVRADDLDGREVTDAFARDGLVCSLLDPTESGEFDKAFLRVARRADLLIVDWVLHGDDGRRAEELIAAVLGKDEENPSSPRLRTIAIYTGTPELDRIADRIGSLLANVYPEHPLEPDESGLAMTRGPVRIAVLAKPHVDLPAHLRPRQVDFGDLPGRMRDEFATLTEGLVTCVALSGLAALRDDTHRVLKMLHKGLDPAFLGHRSGLPAPSDAEEHAVDWVMHEFRSVIDQHRIGRKVSAEVLKAWMQHPRDADFRFGAHHPKGGTLTPEQVQHMVTDGLCDDAIGAYAAPSAEAGASRTQLREIRANGATAVFARSPEEAAKSDAEMARRMKLRTLYAKTERILHLGSIIRVEDGTYLLCVQPDCDSQRITSQVDFPFLRLSAAESEKQRWVPVDTPDEEEPRWLSLKVSPSALRMIPFTPTGGADRVIATETDGEYRFTDATHSEVFILAGELKPHFAQKIAVDLAYEFARVAVDGPEFLHGR